MMPQQNPNGVASNLHQFRIKRGALAVGTDGPLGSIEQIVVDRTTGELRMLIIRATGGQSLLELPATHIQHDDPSGEALYLDIGKDDLAHDPQLAHPYEPEHYAPMLKGEATKPFPTDSVPPSTNHPVITSVEDDAVQLVMPAREPASTPALDDEVPAESPVEAAPATEAVAPADSVTPPVAQTEPAAPIPYSREEQTPTLPLRAIRRSLAEMEALAATDIEAAAPEASRDATNQEPEAVGQDISESADELEVGSSSQPAPVIEEDELVQQQMAAVPAQERVVAVPAPEIQSAVLVIRSDVALLVGTAAAGLGIAAFIGSLLLRRQLRYGNQALQLAESAGENVFARMPQASNRPNRFGRGLVAGIILGLLFAPLSGERLREQMGKRIRHLLGISS